MKTAHFDYFFLPADGHLSCFQFLATMANAAMNIHGVVLCVDTNF